MKAITCHQFFAIKLKPTQPKIKLKTKIEIKDEDRQIETTTPSTV